MYKRVFENLLKNNIDIRGKRIIAGISGGPDSTLLYYFLLYCRKNHSVRFKVIHVNHNERKGAQSEELFVKNMCKKRKVEIALYSDDSVNSEQRRQKGFEMAAREARRKIFLNEARENRADFIMTGHNLDDAVETFFINVERGAGIRGIQSNRLLSRSFMKPLIFLKKSEIREYLDNRRIKYIEDETNADEGITRNRVRRKLMPALESTMKNGIRGFGRMLENTSSVLDLFDFIIEHEISVVRSRNPFILDISKILYYNNKLRKNLLYYIISKDFYVDSALIDRVDSLVLSKKPNLRVAEKNLIIVKSYDEIKIATTDREDAELDAKLVFGEEREFNGYKIRIDKTVVNKGEEKIKSCMLFPFEAGKNFSVRIMKCGDTFIPFGMNSPKRISKFLSS
ncbi:MAG: tRNA lysidine(34) synthetase TilS [bacterium]|nr:tRNA lysidine(34) synthetase TilS [bacterium]